jgi:carboxymethylenebutenolidase
VLLESGWLEFPVASTTARAFRARPRAAREALPAVVLVQEIWGVDEFIVDMAGRFAVAGYLALAPDLYSLGGVRPPELEPLRIARAKAFLDTIPPASWWDDRARTEALESLPAGERGELAATFAGILGPFDWDGVVATLRAAVAFAGADPASSGAVGAVGWCVGGALAGRLACAEPALRAAVVFYGAAPDAAGVPAIACPVLGFYGGADPAITDGVPAFAAAMRAAGKDFDWHVYADAPHAFFNDTRAAYTVGAARHAWAHTVAFLCRHLSATDAAHGETR